MRIISQSARVSDLHLSIPAEVVYKHLEWVGRVSHKSEGKITENSYKSFIERIVFKKGHYGILEHYQVTIFATTDRGVSHELVRHRIASYVQESTRCVNYKDGIAVIQPNFNSHSAWVFWHRTMLDCEKTYQAMLGNGAKPEEARSVLPNSLKTDIVMTLKLKQWIHFICVRYLGTEGKPHPQTQHLAGLIWDELKMLLPLIFNREFV